MRAVPWVVAALAAVFVPSVVAQETPAVPCARQPLRRRRSPSPSPTPPPAPRPPFVAGYKNGFTLQSETGDFVLKLTGYVQADGRFAPGDDANAVTNAVPDAPRAADRPGHGRQVLRLLSSTPTSAAARPSSRTPTSTCASRPSSASAPGKMKTPFGIERLQSGQSLLFVERALPNNLVPESRRRRAGARRAGPGASSATRPRSSNGVPDGGNVDTDTNDAKDLAGRVFFQPWKTKGTSPLRGLGFGVAGTTGQGHTARFAAYISVSQVRVFTYADHRHRQRQPHALVARRAASISGPVGILAEYVEAQPRGPERGRRPADDHRRSSRTRPGA